MAASRKLQGEIDRCLKKVAEGVETFEETWKKVHNTPNHNQKQKHLQEKYEADLKKEIKKLQRLRDQIKSWIASTEIKDKATLLENRRLIETQMERFKVVERETKTKAYSKEGLGAAQKLDPKQRVKDNARAWLNSSIRKLQENVDRHESEMELLVAAKKKRLDRDKQEKLDELRVRVDKNKHHISKLEQLLRLLDNDSVDADQVNKIKDDVEYFIESSEEPDFEENDFIYDDIVGLDEVELGNTATDSNETSGSPSSITSGVSPSPSPITVQTASTPVAATPTQAPSASQFQQQHINGNSSFTSESNTTTSGVQDATSLTERRAKPENIPKAKPIKPTPTRATNPKNQAADGPANKIVSSTPNKGIAPQQPHSQQPYAGTTAAAVVAAGSNQTASSNAANNSSTSIAIGHNPAVQPHAPTPSGNAPAALPPTNISSVQSGQSVVQAVPGIAFAAVAKHNTSLLENGTVVHTPAAPTVAAVVGGNIQAQQQQHAPNQHQQQQQQQQSQSQQQLNSLHTNSSHLQNGLTVPLGNDSKVADTVSLKSIAQDAVNHVAEKETTAPEEAPCIDTRQQPQSVPQQHFSGEPNSLQQQQLQQNVHANSTELSSTINAHRTGLVVTNGPAPNSGTNGVIGPGTHNAAHSNNVMNVNSAHVSQQQTQQQPAQLQQVMPPTKEAHIPPLLGVAPLGAMPLNKEHQKQFQLLEAAYHHLPERQDNERLASYFHITPVQAPPYYPQNHVPNFDTFEFYQRLQTESLFFIFYYMEGSKAQYLAAKALKRQSWRFHTKFMMWFQRHEEPQIINDEYEQGTYIYFDYEKWQQRRKEGFTFEYKYLEDRDLQ